MSRAKARFADAKDAKKKTKTKKIKAAARKETNRESDPSLHGEDVTEQRYSSSSSKVDETPLGVLLAEPHEPKQDPAPAYIILLRLFYKFVLARQEDVRRLTI